MSQLPLLSLLVLTPWLGALIVWALRGTIARRPLRAISFWFSWSTLAIGVALLADFEPAITAMQFVERRPWIAALNVNYHLGLDGLSLVLVLLTGIVSPLALASGSRESESAGLHDGLFLTLQGAALGTFVTLDFFPWFICWELSLVPAFFLIKIWGGSGAARAAYQFVIYTMAGSALLLFGFVAIYAATGTFDFVELAALARTGVIADRLGEVGGVWSKLVFLGVLLGFAVKVPLFPLHTWLPPAYAEAPTGTSMFLTSVMSKMGMYGFLRIVWPLFAGDLRDWATPLLWLAVAGIVLGAFAALKQSDLKRMVAYSSVNHLSYCLLALFAILPVGQADAPSTSAALGGIILQIFNHGVSAAALFACIGILEQRSGGRGSLLDFGGVRSAAPRFAAFCGVALFSSLGLPGLNGFVGEFLIFRGVFALESTAAAVSTLGLLATAMFLLTFWQKVFHGPPAGAGVGFRDLDRREMLTLLPLIALMIVLGVMPQLLVRLFDPLVAAWTHSLP